MNALAALAGALSGLLLTRHWIGAAAGAALGLFIASGLARGVFAGLAPGGDDIVPALFRLLGRLAKSDGQVSQAEIDLCEELLARLRVQGRARQAAIAAFNAGREPGADCSDAFAVLRQSRRHAGLFMEVFVDMALADGGLHADERHLLGKYAWMLGVPEAVLESLLLRRGQGRARRDGGGDPYAVLGVPPGASDAEVRRAFRRLVSEHHPDKLAARGATADAVCEAQQRTQAILAAYERIKSARGIK